MGDSYDAVVVGGGFCGAGVATVLARAGFSCLVLERDEVFLDHTKGEWIAPWGVAEAQRVGLSTTSPGRAGTRWGATSASASTADVGSPTPRDQTLRRRVPPPLGAQRNGLAEVTPVSPCAVYPNEATWHRAALAPQRARAGRAHARPAVRQFDGGRAGQRVQ